MRLLLVEDNERFAALLKQGLAAAGFVVDVLSTAQDAAAALRTSRFEIMQGALKIVLVGQHRKTGRAALFVSVSDESRMEIRLQQAAARRSFLDLGDDGRLARPQRRFEISRVRPSFLRLPLQLRRAQVQFGGLPLFLLNDFG